jgi:hypothetical protein
VPIKQEFKYTPREGEELITLHQWVSTLPENEQTEFQQAEQQQLELRQKVIKDKKLTVVKNSRTDATIYDNYVWDESHCENKTIPEYKDYNDIWLSYWNRYLEETGTKFEIIETKI